MAKAREPIRTQTRPTATRKGLVVGYKRVSALDQADLRQLHGLETDKLFTDKASEKTRTDLSSMRWQSSLFNRSDLHTPTTAPSISIQA